MTTAGGGGGTKRCGGHPAGGAAGGGGQAGGLGPSTFAAFAAPPKRITGGGRFIGDAFTGTAAATAVDADATSTGGMALDVMTTQHCVHGTLQPLTEQLTLHTSYVTTVDVHVTVTLRLADSVQMP